MEVIVHYPKSVEGMQALQERIAKVHAQAIISYIQKLTCPEEQKKQLLKEIIQSLRDN